VNRDLHASRGNRGTTPSDVSPPRGRAPLIRGCLWWCSLLRALRDSKRSRCSHQLISRRRKPDCDPRDLHVADEPAWVMFGMSRGIQIEAFRCLLAGVNCEYFVFSWSVRTYRDLGAVSQLWAGFACRTARCRESLACGLRCVHGPAWQRPYGRGGDRFPSSRANHSAHQQKFHY
jgi:hypothetical protein